MKQLITSIRYNSNVLVLEFAFKYFFRRTENVYFVGCMAVVLSGVFIAFPLSYLNKSNLLIGVVLFPFVLRVGRRQHVSYLYLFSLILFALIAFYYHIRISYFFTLAFFILFLVELFIGEVNKVVLFLLVFMSPFFQIIAVIVGFPIRLQLSAWAGQILSLVGSDVRVEGNIMLLNGLSFSVDEACMGLNMLVFSMLIGALALAHQLRMSTTNLSFSKISLFFMVVLFLDIVCNLLRILILIVFKIPAENPMHEIAGLLCFGMYVIVPVYFLSRWVVRKYGRPDVSVDNIVRFTSGLKFIVVATTLLLFFTGIYIKIQKEKELIAEHLPVTIAGFKAERMRGGITKLFNTGSLVYIKPIAEFFTPEHTPLICWAGSGFRFEGIRKTVIDGHEIYIGQLVKPGKNLFTAWWYSNGAVQTIDQFDWRMRMLKGEARFCLINVTSNSEAALNDNLKKILDQKISTINQ